MYIFTPPKVAYQVSFNYVDLSNFIKQGRNNRYARSAKLGTTVTVEHVDFGVIAIKLYDTVIAEVTDRSVYIPEDINNHGSQATTWWTQKVLSDNKLPGFVSREKGKYAVAGKMYQRA